MCAAASRWRPRAGTGRADPVCRAAFRGRCSPRTGLPTNGASIASSTSARLPEQLPTRSLTVALIRCRSTITHLHNLITGCLHDGVVGRRRVCRSQTTSLRCFVVFRQRAWFSRCRWRRVRSSWPAVSWRRRVAGWRSRPSVLRRLRPVSARSVDDEPSPTTVLEARQRARAKTVPTFTVIRSTKEEPNSVPAASPRLPRSTSPWPPEPTSTSQSRSSLFQRN